jgi:HEAT repeat protein
MKSKIRKIKNIFFLFFLFGLIPFLSLAQEKQIPEIKENIPKLIEELGDSDIITNYYAGRKLVKIGKEAVPYLIKALDSENGRIRISSIIILDQIKDERAIPEFIRILKDEKRKDRERSACALSLGKMKAKEASDVLIQNLSDSSNTLKIACIMALGELKEEKAIPYLLKLTKDNEEAIKKASISALKSIGEIGIPVYEKIIEDGSFEEKILAIEILGEIKSEKSIELLKKILKSENKYLSISSAYILSSIGNTEGEAVANKLKKDTDPKVRTLALQTLENINKIKEKQGVAK